MNRRDDEIDESSIKKILLILQNGVATLNAGEIDKMLLNTTDRELFEQKIDTEIN